MKNTNLPAVTLNNGVEMPMEGFGVYQIEEAEACERAVGEALAAGYRLLDTASVYGNEEAVGRAIRQSGVPRSELFVTTKVWIDEAGEERTKRALEASLERLGLEYLDLYLVHMPLGDYYGSWRAMETFVAAGRVRAIGVCNFSAARLIDFCRNVNVLPAVDQVELHPFFQRQADLEVMRQLGVRAEAWGPFAEGLNGIFSHAVLQAIGRRYGKTPAQVVLRWHVQRGVIVIPKSVHRERIEENLDIWDFSLTDEEMALLSPMDAGRSMILDLEEPATIERLYAID